VAQLDLVVPQSTMRNVACACRCRAPGRSGVGLKAGVFPPPWEPTRSSLSLSLSLSLLSMQSSGGPHLSDRCASDIVSATSARNGRFSAALSLMPFFAVERSAVVMASPYAAQEPPLVVSVHPVTISSR
jgi:hypothetical protein